MGAEHPVSRHTYRTPANIMTLVRILLTPFVIVAIYLSAPSWWVVLFAFVVMFTDRVDGILARRYGTSSIGTFMDSLADKVLVLGSMIILVATDDFWWLPVAIIALREVAMSVWRSRLASRGISVPARQSGKYKVWVQSLAVGLALIPGVQSHAALVVDLCLWVAVAFTAYSFAQYVFDAKRTGDPVARSEANRASHSAN